MARKERPKITEEKLQGFKYFKILGPLLDSLHKVGTQRDRAATGHRIANSISISMALCCCFISSIPSRPGVRGIQQASHLEKVQKKLGCRGTCLGSLSEAASVFNAQHLEEIIAELAARIPQQTLTREQQALKNLTAVDGSLRPALSKMAWVL